MKLNETHFLGVEAAHLGIGAETQSRFSVCHQFQPWRAMDCKFQGTLW